eukprot:3828220-Amphidinium_carterae.1
MFLDGNVSSIWKVATLSFQLVCGQEHKHGFNATIPDNSNKAAVVPLRCEISAYNKPAHLAL